MTKSRADMDHYLELEFVLGMLAKAGTHLRETANAGRDLQDARAALDYWAKRMDRLTS